MSQKKVEYQQFDVVQLNTKIQGHKKGSITNISELQKQYPDRSE